MRAFHVPCFLLCLLLVICPWMSHIASLAAVSWDELEGAQDLSQLEHCCLHVWATWRQAHPPQLRPDPNRLSWEMLPWPWCLSWRIRPKWLLSPDDRGKDARNMKNVRCWLAGRRQSSKYLCGWKERDGFNCALVPDSMIIMGWGEITTAHNSSCSLSPAWKADSSHIVSLIWRCKKVSPRILTHAGVYLGPSQKVESYL